MAEMLAVFFVDQLKRIEQHVMLAVDAKDEVMKLQKTFKTLQKVLKDAEQRQFDDETVKDWLDEFKDVAYDMEDLLDEWNTEILRSQIEGHPPDKNHGNYKQMIKKKVSFYLCSPFSTCFRKADLYYDIGSRIKHIRERLDSICDEQRKFEFTKSSPKTFEVYDIPGHRKTSAVVVNASKIIPRDSEKLIILNRLLGETTTTTSTNSCSSSSSSSSCSNNQLVNETYDPRIISIIGMGGLGKTTLAQLIISDDKVKTHFQKTLWVCISEPFDRTRIAKAIINEAGQSPPNSSEWNALHVQLRESVKRNLFLLVLDDVWTDDEDNLDFLKDLLSLGAYGSRIMLTTRKQSVAETMNSYQYSLKLLSFDDCWSLLSSKAFEGRRIEENKVLKDICFEIAKKCRGLPLTASLLGGLLKKKKTESEWRSVLESKIWESEEVEQKLFKPLLLSYADLKSPLKRCFAYCAIFPKDYWINKHTLIRMWMAQGFLYSTTGWNLDSRSIGKKYFDDLAERSFFQDFSQDDNGDDDDNGITIRCKMHNIVHDLAQFLTRNEFYMKQTSDKPLINDSNIKARHLVLTFPQDDEDMMSALYAKILKAKKLRSLLSNSTYFSNMHALSADFFHHLRCLRVLKMKYLDIAYFPSEIKELIHLRYLDLSYSEPLNELPDSVCSLYNLETMKLKGCKRLEKLPRGMGRLINLKHLDIRGSAVELSFVEGTGKLISTNFVVTGSSEVCNTRELKDLILLEVCIDIRGLGKLKTAKEASKVKLLKKKREVCSNIDDGTMTSSSEGVEKDLDLLVVEITEGLLGVLQLHPNLKELTISNKPDLKLGSWASSLTYLRILNLSNIHNCTELPALGLLPSLEDLILVNLYNLTRIGVELYGNDGEVVVFPKLRKLFICTDNLEEWNIGDGVIVAKEIMPNLTSVTLKSKKLKVLPAVWKLSSLETLIIKGSTKVSHIGPAFYGCVDTAVDGGGCGSFNLTAFPNLKLLRVEYMEGLEEFDLGVDLEGRGGNTREDQIIIMPRLKNMTIYECSKLKIVRALSKLQSLEVLDLHNVVDLEAIEAAAERGREDSIMMPCLLSLDISLCPKLKSLQQHHLPKLIYLRIMYCCSLLQLPVSPNLISLEIFSSSLPQGLARFEKLQHLCFYKCSFLTCIPEDVRHLIALQTLEIQKCHWPSQTNPDCIIDQEEEAWSIMSHIPKIIIKGSTYKIISQITRIGTRQHSYTSKN